MNKLKDAKRKWRNTMNKWRDEKSIWRDAMSIVRNVRIKRSDIMSNEIWGCDKQMKRWEEKMKEYKE
jgi:sucrose-6-phosphate hydrolase SacC (GH32 family)